MSRTATVPPVKIGEKMLEELDELVEKGFYRSRSDAVRHAIAFLVRDYQESLKIRRTAAERVRKARKELEEECLEKAGGDKAKAWDILLRQYG